MFCFIPELNQFPPELETTHTIFVSLVKINQIPFHMYPHPPYWPDLAPLLVNSPKKTFGRPKIPTNDNAIAYFEELDSCEFYQVIDALNLCWPK